MNDYIAAVLFFLPAGLSNMSPVVANMVPVLTNWKTPLDFGKTWRGKRIFGTNKTWRGLVIGTLVGGLSAVVIGWLNPNVLGPYNQFVAGLLLGFGALAGDAIESFFKRQIGIQPGYTWFPFDQLDYIVGGLLAVRLLTPIPWWVVGTVFFVYFFMHLATVFVFYKLGVRDRPI